MPNSDLNTSAHRLIRYVIAHLKESEFVCGVTVADETYDVYHTQIASKLITVALRLVGEGASQKAHIGLFETGHLSDAEVVEKLREGVPSA